MAGYQPWNRNYGMYEMPSIEDRCLRLWELDKGRLRKRVDYKVSAVPDNFIHHVARRIDVRPTFQAFSALIDTYDNRSPNDDVDRIRKEDKFIDEVLRTPVMQSCRDMLRQDAYFTGNSDDFRQELQEIWFSGSAFQHVFVGMKKKRTRDQIKGLHSWYHWHQLKQQGRIKNLSIDEMNDVVATVSYLLDGLRNHEGSMFLGTTPEFELALFTFLYFVNRSEGGGKATFDLQLGDAIVPVVIITRDDNLLTAYPTKKTHLRTVHQ